MTYVIYLNSNNEWDGKSGNAYGYWTGKSYKSQGEVFPVTENYITSNTKIYQSKVRALKAGDNCYMNYGYVKSVLIEENLVV